MFTDLKSGALEDYYEFIQVTNSLKLRLPRSYFVEENIYYRNDTINKSLGGETYYNKYSDNIRRIIILKSNNLPITNFLKGDQWYAGGASLRRFIIYQAKLRENTFTFKYVHKNPKVLVESYGYSMANSEVMFDVYERIFSPLLGNSINNLVLKMSGISGDKTITSLLPEGYNLTYTPSNASDFYGIYYIYEKELHNETLTVRFINDNFHYKEFNNMVDIELRLEVV